MQEPVVSIAVRRASRSLRGHRVTRSVASRLGELLGENPARVLRGRLPSGGRILLLAGDHAHRHIYFYGEYEPEVTRAFEDLLRPGLVVFDVGANAGYFSLLSA